MKLQLVLCVLAALSWVEAASLPLQDSFRNFTRKTCGAGGGDTYVCKCGNVKQTGLVNINLANNAQILSCNGQLISADGVLAGIASHALSLCSSGGSTCGENGCLASNLDLSIPIIGSIIGNGETNKKECCKNAFCANQHCSSATTGSSSSTSEANCCVVCNNSHACRKE